jgi:hypothetical protein
MPRPVAAAARHGAATPPEVVDGWTLAGWLRTAGPDLGEPPFDAPMRGNYERVLVAHSTVPTVVR